MEDQYRSVIRQKIVDGEAAPPPPFTRRDVWLPTVPGKAVAVIGMRGGRKNPPPPPGVGRPPTARGVSSPATARRKDHAPLAGAGRPPGPCGRRRPRSAPRVDVFRFRGRAPCRRSV